MKYNKKTFLLSNTIFFAVLSASWWFFFTIVDTLNYVILNGPNNIASPYGLSKEQIDPVATALFYYFVNKHHTAWEWTIGKYNNTPGFIAIILGFVAVVLFVLYLLEYRKTNMAPVQVSHE